MGVGRGNWGATGNRTEKLDQFFDPGSKLRRGKPVVVPTLQRLYRHEKCRSQLLSPRSPKGGVLQLLPRLPAWRSLQLCLPGSYSATKAQICLELVPIPFRLNQTEHGWNSSGHAAIGTYHRSRAEPG